MDRTSKTPSTTSEVNRTSFLDLPPELRNLIYAFALTSERRVELSYFLNPNITREDLDRHPSVLDQSKKPRYVVAVSNFNNNLENIAFGLLLADRQISIETMPMLYALTLLATKDCRILSSFLRLIGDKVKLIHRVQIHCSRPESLCLVKTMKHLEDAISLETLELGPSFREYYTPEQLAKILAPLTRALGDHRGNTSKDRAPIEIVFMHEANPKTLLSGTRFQAPRSKDEEHDEESSGELDHEPEKDFRSIKNYITALKQVLRRSP